ncbi:hypothetical protein [Aquimarina sp. SS2-1]|uniref:hypothetical protein n=1 Tax=Aquimarina besae TaxID=3342247 RepID=UPI00366F3ACE
MNEKKHNFTVKSILFGLGAIIIQGAIFGYGIYLWIEIFNGNFDYIDSPIPLNLVIMFISLVPIFFIINLLYKIIMRKSVKSQMIFIRSIFSEEKENNEV